MKHEFIKDVHYYTDGTRVVFTALYHIQRGECCGSKCRHCPFDPQYQKGNEIVKEELVSLEKKP
jgi:biotin synthase-like enzyme